MLTSSCTRMIISFSYVLTVQHDYSTRTGNHSAFLQTHYKHSQEETHIGLRKTYNNCERKGPSQFSTLSSGLAFKLKHIKIFDLSLRILRLSLKTLGLKKKKKKLFLFVGFECSCVSLQI